MRLIIVFLYIVSLVSASPSNVCANPVYSKLTAALSGYPPAKDFCSKHFPQPVVTVTASPKLVRKDAVVNESQNKRAELSPRNEQLWSSLKAQAEGIISTFCYCINPPRTTTVHPSTTKKGTAAPTTGPWIPLTTSKATPRTTPNTTPKTTPKLTPTTTSKTSPSTTPKSTPATTPSTTPKSTPATTPPTTPKTTPSTTSPTTTTKSTSTTSAPAVCQAGNKPPPATKQCPYGDTCVRTEVGCSLQPTDSACQQGCNDPKYGCYAYNYNPANSQCVLYGDCPCRTTCDASRPPPPVKSFGCPAGGSCVQPEVGCTLVATDSACQQACNDPKYGCNAYIYNPLTGKCVLYGNCNCVTTCDSVRPPPPVRTFGCPASGSCVQSEVGCSLVLDDRACGQACNNNPGCVSYIFNGSTGKCVLYANCNCITTCDSVRPPPPVRTLGCPASGSCVQPEVGCSLVLDDRACGQACNNNPGCVSYVFNGSTGKCVLYGNCNCPA